MFCLFINHCSHLLFLIVSVKKITYYKNYIIFLCGRLLFFPRFVIYHNSSAFGFSAAESAPISPGAQMPSGFYPVSSLHRHSPAFILSLRCTGTARVCVQFSYLPESRILSLSSLVPACSRNFSSRVSTVMLSRSLPVISRIILPSFIIRVRFPVSSA